METIVPVRVMLAQFRRKVLNKSQAQFAAMLGVSKDAIVSMECGRNQLSPKLAKQIRTVTGLCVVSPKAKDAQNFRQQQNILRYTRQDYERWRQRYKNDESRLRQLFDEVGEKVGLLYRAALRAGGNRARLPGLHQSLCDWADVARTHFNLEIEIDQILEETTRQVVTNYYPLEALQKEKELTDYIVRLLGVKPKALWAGFKKVKAPRSDVILFFKVECRHVWNHVGERIEPRSGWNFEPCRTPQLLPKPKYWFDTEPSEEDEPLSPPIPSLKR